VAKSSLTSPGGTDPAPGASANARRVRRAAKRLGAALVLLVLLLGAAEAVLRSSASTSAGGAENALEWGIRGFRGASFERERDPRGVRVIVVGDDSAYGRALAEEHTWPRLLEGRFARDGMASRVQVVNGAESTADSARTLELVEGELIHCQPTWLVVSLGVEDALRPLEAPSEPAWWERSAVGRAVFGAAADEERGRELVATISRGSFAELRRRTQFHFGVRVAKLVELAWTRRSYVMLVAPPWPASEAPPAQGAGSGPHVLDGPSAARELHAALVDELLRVAEQSDAVFVDARGAAQDAAAPSEAATTLEQRIAQQVASRVHSALRQRMR
jgi:hypothetical protein